MTLDTFFKTFDQFADAPDAVAKMRELVLQLAIQGELVEPSSKPEADRAWLAFKKEISERIYSYDPGPPPPFEIPNHWEWCVLVEVADCRASAKVPPASISDKDWVLDLEDIDGTTGQIIQFATFAERRSLSTKAVFEPGDVLYSKLRPYLNKVVVAEKKGFCTTEIIPLRPTTFHEPGFLRIYLRSLTFLHYAAQKNYGMKMPRLGTKDLESAQIPLPPPSEQKRIVAKVDELMALCDSLESQQQSRDEQARALARASLARFAEAPTRANLNLLFHKSYSISPADLRQSVLTLAIQGKLVGKDSKEEPVTTSFPTLASVAVSKDRITPKHWISVPLGKLGEWRGGGTPSKSNPDFWEGLIPWVSPKDMKVLHISDAQDHISKDAVEGSSVRMIPKGSILMVVRGMILARAFPVAATTREVTINQDMKALLPFDARAEDYLLLALRALEPQVLAMIERSTHGTCKLETKPLHALTIPIPPLAEQRRIVAKVDQLMALVDQLETKLAASRATAKSLLEALVAELTNANRP